MSLDDLDVMPGDMPPGEDDPIGDRVAQLLAALLDSAALDSIPPPRPVIDGLLYADSLAWLHGKPGNGKSFVALDWAGCVASGLPWQEREATQGGVLYLAAEGTAGVRQRVRAWEDYARATWDGLVLPVAAQLLAPVDGAAVAELAARLRPLLVVIDTQARVTTGHDENSARDMGLYVAAADRIRAACGACVLTVHHEARNGDNMRGSTALEGAAATVMRVSKDGSLVTVSTVKQKDVPAADDVRLRLVPRLASAVLVSNELIRNTGEVTDSEDKVMATLLELFVGISASPKQIIETSKLPQSTVYRALSLLVSRGRVMKGGTKARPLYELAKSELPTLLTASNPTGSQTSNLQPPFRGLEGLEAVSSGAAPARVKVAGDLYHGSVPDGAVYVGRRAHGLPASKFANPFKGKPRAELAASYREWISGQPELLAAARAELAGHDLACWCQVPRNGEPDHCHAAVLLDIANADSRAAGNGATP